MSSYTYIYADMNTKTIYLYTETNNLFSLIFVFVSLKPKENTIHINLICEKAKVSFMEKL